MRLSALLRISGATAKPGDQAVSVAEEVTLFVVASRKAKGLEVGLDCTAIVHSVLAHILLEYHGRVSSLYFKRFCTLIDITYFSQIPRHTSSCFPDQQPILSPLYKYEHYERLLIY